MNDATEQLDLPEAAAPSDASHTDVLSCDAAPPVNEPADNQRSVPPAQMIAGYQLIEHIGQGGYGEVWRAEAPGGMQKAVKIIYGQADERRAVEELKSLQRIKDARHPFLLSLERIDIIDGKLIVVSELADESLKQRYERCAASGSPGIPRDDLLRILAEAADALDYMSSRHGLAHLDIKPENILLVGDHTKVADFGLVKDVHGATQSIVGGLTPLFAAPETFDGRPGDRSDQYSLAVVYQFALTGKLPFSGTTTAQLASQHISGRPDLSSLPDADRSVVERALAKDPFDRFDSCRAFVDRLMSARGGTALPAAEVRESGAGDSEDDGFHTEVIEGEASKTSNRTTDPNAMQAARRSIEDLPVVTCSTAPPRPTLVIGLGGCGAMALRCLYDRIEERLGDDELPEQFSALLIDSDYDDFVANFVDVDRTSLEERNFVHLALKPTQYYRQNASELTRWLSRRWIYNIPRNMKTDGIRPLGRLALVDHMEHVEGRIEEAVTALGETGVPPQVILVGSLSGGTGGAIYADIAQVVHRAFARHENVEADIICALAHWTSASAEDAELATVNSCAALTELNHYKLDGCPGDVTCHLPPLGRHHGLFKDVYYVNFGGQSQRLGFEFAADKLAKFIETNSLAEVAQFGSACRLETAASQPGVATLRSFGIASVAASELAEAEQTSQHLAAHVLSQTFLSGGSSDHLAAESQAAAARVVTESELSQAELTMPFDRLNQRRGDELLKKLATVDQPRLASEWDSWRSLIDQNFPPQPKLQKPDETGQGSVEAAIAKLVQERAAALHRRLLACLQGTGNSTAAFIGPLLESLIEHFESIKTSAAADRVAADPASIGPDGDPLSQLTAYVEQASLRNTAAWLYEVAELMQSSLVKMLQRAKTCVAAAARIVAEYSQLEEDQTGVEVDEHLAGSVIGEFHEFIESKYGDLAQMLLRYEIDVPKLAERLAKLAEQAVRRQHLNRLVSAASPDALANGGARRLLVAAPADLIEGEFVKNLCKRLPAPPTKLVHDRREVLLWCDAEQIRLEDVVDLLVGHRTELRELASRLRVRNDVTWANLS